MANDFLTELKYLGVTARLKRLNDLFSSNIKELYVEHKIDIEPSWHLVFLILKKRQAITMSELADEFQFSQPAATKIINRMQSKGYVKVSGDKQDKRKKIITLTAKAKQRLPKFEKIWNAGQKSIQQMLKSNSSFLKNLEHFENEYTKENFKERVQKNLK